MSLPGYDGWLESGPGGPADASSIMLDMFIEAAQEVAANMHRDLPDLAHLDADRVNDIAEAVVRKMAADREPLTVEALLHGLQVAAEE